MSHASFSAEPNHTILYTVSSVIKCIKPISHVRMQLAKMSLLPSGHPESDRTLQNHSQTNLLEEQNAKEGPHI